MLTTADARTTTGGSVLGRLLRAYGIPYVFGVPGESAALLRELYDEDHESPRHIVFRDERNAPYAAIAYTRATGRVVALDAAPSVGTLMMIPGLAEALNMSVPLVLLATDVPTSAGHRRLYGAHSQASDQTRILAPALKYHAEVTTVEAIPGLLRQALLHATTGRPGPVALVLPSDVLEADASEVDLGSAPPELARISDTRPVPDAAATSEACRLLSSARRPAILAGGGAALAGAGPAIVRLAERLAIPVATTLSGAGVIDEEHRLALGTAGDWGLDCATKALTRADLVFLIGAKSSKFSTADWSYPGQDQLSVHLDVDPTEPRKIVPDSLPLVGDARAGVESLLEVAGERTRAGEEWLRECDQLKGDSRQWFLERASGAAGGVSGFELMKAIEDRLTPGDVLVCDASSACGWASHVRIPAGAVRLPFRGIATLGSSLGGALGARLADPDATVIQLAGDGGHAYHLGELATVKRLGMKLVSVILNNSALGAVATWPGYPSQAAEIGSIDFAKTAEACGWTGLVAESGDALPALMDHAFASEGPVLIDARTDPRETPTRPEVG
jgi:acetolactate synthase I/II/III large subunit